MDLMSRLELACVRNPKRIVLPESDDPRILAAASRVAARSAAHPVLIGSPERILMDSERLGISTSGVAIVDPEHHPGWDSFVEQYMEMRKGRHLTPGIASKVLSKSLHFGAMLVRVGEADGLVAGSQNLTASVIKAGKLFIGLSEGLTEPSSFFIMDVPGRGEMVFADCAVNPSPDPELLAQIAVASARSTRALLAVEPRVAMLSFSTKGSADHPDVRKVIEATKIAKSISPELKIDGEMQADAALVPEIAERKKVKGDVGGQANVLVFPDLDAANVAYKLVQHLAGASAYGPFMQGFKKPINDLSRGCTTDEIVGTIMVTSIQSGDA